MFLDGVGWFKHANKAPAQSLVQSIHTDVNDQGLQIPSVSPRPCLVVHNPDEVLVAFVGSDQRGRRDLLGIRQSAGAELPPPTAGGTGVVGLED